MIVFACRTSPPSRCTCRLAASIRVIERVTRISAPSRRACRKARLASSSPETPEGSRGSSRSWRTCRPGRLGASRSTAIVRSPSDAPYTAAARPAGPAPMITVSYSAAVGSVGMSRSSATRRSCGWQDGLAVHDANGGEVAFGRSPRGHCSTSAGTSGLSQVKLTWLRSRKCLTSAQEASHRWPRTIARGGAGLTLEPAGPLAPPSRCIARRPTRSPISGDAAASSW